jgi:hypothetical protein
VWCQPPDHPVHALFRRAIDDGSSYVPVGSPGDFLFPPIPVTLLNDI